MSAYSSLQNVTWYGLPAIVTGNVLIKTGPGNLTGVIVSSHTSGTIKFWDSLTAANTVLVDTYTYATGSQTITFFGAKFTTGLFADVGGTTQKITVIYN